MKDALGREIEYLRLAVTEKCSLRCMYCSPDDPCGERSELSVANIGRIVKACLQLGLGKVRLTGGEPLMRRDLEHIVSTVAALDGLKDLSMTTNGQGLLDRANALYRAGLKRVNISIDSLNPQRYKRITGGGDIVPVLEGIEQAIKAGFFPVKLNVVLVAGENDDEVDDFIALAKDMPIEVRFIELMPIGPLGAESGKSVTNAQLIAQRPWLKPLPCTDVGQPSKDYAIEGYVGKTGFISPMSHKFCHCCNRIRITSDSVLKTCLGANNEIYLQDALAATDDDLLLQSIYNGIMSKPSGHSFDEGYNSQRNMNRIGG